MNKTRRSFLKSGGSVLIYFSLTGCDQATKIIAADSIKTRTDAKLGDVKVSNWIQLNANGTVSLALGKVEIGQGIGTALAQIAAEELHIDFARIKLLAVDTAHSPDEYYTFSSISVQVSGQKVRNAAASGFNFLTQAAADKLGIDRSALTVSDGEFFKNGTSADLSFWNLLEGKHHSLSVTEELAYTPPAKYKIVGKSIARIDIPAKVFGKAAFLQDLRLPDMLHARLVRPPAPRAAIANIDTSSALKLSGVVKIVQDGNFIAVLAEREGQARIAATNLKESLNWNLASDLPASDNLYNWLKKAPCKTENIESKPSSAPLAPALKTLNAVYQRPYQCHASISPSAAVALFENDSLTIWSHAQGMYPLRNAIALILGLAKHQVRCIHREASGCYGHNGADDAACEAAVLAMQVPGRPVRLQWERQDEFLWEPLGSAMQIEVSAGLDNTGMVHNWQYDLWSCSHSSRPTPAAAGNFLYAQLRANPLPAPPPRSIPQPNGGADRNGVPLYDFQSMEVRKHLVQETPLRTSALRSLGAYANVFAIESFMDELALIANQDPLAFRLQHLSNARAINVLQKLGSVSEWSSRPNPGNGLGWGMGFAQFKNISSYLGVVVQVKVDAESSQIRLNRAIAVCDAGLVINPDGLRAQIEGGIVQSASWTLNEKLRFDTTEVQTSDWMDYPILRFDEIPEIEVMLINTNAELALGVGEAAQGPTAAAIANALYHASGQRLRRLPLTLHHSHTSKLPSQSLA